MKRAIRMKKVFSIRIQTTSHVLGGLTRASGYVKSSANHGSYMGALSQGKAKAYRAPAGYLCPDAWPERRGASLQGPQGGAFQPGEPDCGGVVVSCI